MRFFSSRKRFLLFIAMALGLFLLALFSIKPERYGSLFEGRVRAAIQQAKLPLTFQDLALSPLQIRLGKVHYFFAPLFLQLEATEVTLRPQWGSLLTNEPSFRGSAKAYSGLLDFSASWNKDLKRLDAQTQIINLFLAQHPQLSAFGVKKGIINVTIPSLRKTPQQSLPQGTAVIEIKDLQKEGEHILPSYLTGAPLPITVPNFTIASAQIDFELQPPQALFSLGHMKSSWGSLKGKGSLSFSPQGKVQRFQIKGRASLSPKGRDDFGQWLAVLSSGTLQNTDTRFRFEASGTPSKPQLRFFTLR